MANPNWVKGVSGNPGGRPAKRNTWAAALARVGREKDDDGVTRKIRTARKHYELAEAGDLNEWQAIMNREDGNPMNTEQSDVRHVVEVVLPDDNDGDEAIPPETPPGAEGDMEESS